MLNHSQVATSAIYARLSTDPQREALEAVQGKLLAALGTDDPMKPVLKADQ